MQISSAEKYSFRVDETPVCGKAQIQVCKMLSSSMLSLTSPSQMPGGSYPSHGGHWDRILKLKRKTCIQGCSKVGVWSRPNGNLHACYFRVPWKRWFRLHETTLSQEGSICHCSRFPQLEASAGHRTKKTHLAAAWRVFIFEIQIGFGRGRLLR